MHKTSNFSGKKIAAVVLAAGKGTRIDQSIPKVLSRIAGKPMIYHTLKLLDDVGITDRHVVVGYHSDEVMASIGANVNYVYQWEAKGTAHAVQGALKELPIDIDTIIVLNGDDSAFYEPTSIRKFIENHHQKKAVLSLMVVEKEDPQQLGRVVHDKQGNIKAVVEAKEAGSEELKIKLVNSGCYCFSVSWLKANIHSVKEQNGEYYLPGLVAVAVSQGHNILSYQVEGNEWFGVNTQAELKRANQEMISRLALQHQPTVFFIDLDNTLIDTMQFKDDVLNKIVQTVRLNVTDSLPDDEIRQIYTECYEKLRQEHGYVDIPQIIRLFLSKMACPHLEETIKTLFFTTKFDIYLFPHAVELLEVLKKVGRVVLFVEGGDLVYVPIKIRNTKLDQYIDESYVFENEKSSIDDMLEIYKSWSVYLINDKAQIIEMFRQQSPLVTGFWISSGPYKGILPTNQTSKPQYTMSDLSQVLTTIKSIFRI